MRLKAALLSSTASRIASASERGGRASMGDWADVFNEGFFSFTK